MVTVWRGVGNWPRQGVHPHVRMEHLELAWSTGVVHRSWEGVLGRFMSAEALWKEVDVLRSTCLSSPTVREVCVC